jgi:hypothetical protein
MSRPQGKNHWKSVLNMLGRESNPAVSMLWSSVLGSWRQGEYDVELEEVLKRQLLEVVSGPDGDPIALIMQISYVWHGYASVVRSPEYLHLWFDTAEAAVSRATPLRRRLFASKVAGSAYWAVEVEKDHNGPFHNRAVALVLELGGKEIPGTLSDPTSKRTGATENWKSGIVRLRTPEMADGLKRNATTWSSVEREFMEECLLAWHAFETNVSTQGK